MSSTELTPLSLASIRSTVVGAAGAVMSVTLKEIRLGVGSLSSPPLALPPSSCTAKSKASAAVPVWPGVEVYFRRSRLISKAVTKSPSFRSSHPEPSFHCSLSTVGTVVTVTPLNWFPSMSVNPKSLAVRIRSAPSASERVLSAPDGASLIGVTVTVTVCTALSMAPSVALRVTMRSATLGVSDVLLYTTPRSTLWNNAAPVLSPGVPMVSTPVPAL